MTDLLDEARYPAADLLEVYLKRWEIERVFQKIVEVFHLEHLIGSTPEATIFQASFCLVLYNLLQVMRGFMAAGQAGLAADEVSMEKLFADVHEGADGAGGPVPVGDDRGLVRRGVVA